MSKRSWNDYKELDVDGHYCLRRASLRALETVPQKTWQTLLFSTCSFLIRFCLFRKVKKPSNKKKNHFSNIAGEHLNLQKKGTGRHRKKCI